MKTITIKKDSIEDLKEQLAGAMKDLSKARMKVDIIESAIEFKREEFINE